MVVAAAGRWGRAGLNCRRPFGRPLMCSQPGPPLELASLKQSRLSRLAARDPHPGRCALRGCGRCAPSALWRYGAGNGFATNLIAKDAHSARTLIDSRHELAFFGRVETRQVTTDSRTGFKAESFVRHPISPLPEAQLHLPAHLTQRSGYAIHPAKLLHRPGMLLRCLPKHCKLTQPSR